MLSKKSSPLWAIFAQLAILMEFGIMLSNGSNEYRTRYSTGYCFMDHVNLWLNEIDAESVGQDGSTCQQLILNSLPVQTPALMVAITVAEAFFA